MAALIVALGTTTTCFATTIAIDTAAGTGFDDPTPVAPIAGNTGTTLGQQRLIVFQQAANQWAALLNSSVVIKVQASMAALGCTATSATLGMAGPQESIANFPGARSNTTAYSIAEANALAGADLNGANDEILAQFNITLDAANASCLGGETWWYGIDPSVAPAAKTIPLLPVVFHELGHGLGFISGLSDSGDFLLGGDTPVWADYLFDTQTGKLWKDMNSTERLASSKNDPHLVWTGPRANKQAREWLKLNNALIINAPAALGTQAVGTAQFGPAVPAAGITNALVLVNDGVTGSGTTTDGCDTPFTNAASLSGKIAVMDRGLCSFVTKTKNAQTQGAIAAIIVDNTTEFLGLPLTMTGVDATVTIPSYSVSQAVGLAIEADLPSGVNATLGYSNLGLNQGCVRMFAPSTFVGGSSVSHFHTDAFPNLLMEPALNTSIFNKVDLTLPLFADIDWSVNSEEFLLYDGFDKNPCQHVQL